MANKTVHLPMAAAATCARTPGGPGRRLTVVVLLGFIVYATFRAFEGTSYEWGAYLSPFYSPFFDVSWAKAYGLGVLHAGDAHPARARELPVHLLLLPQGLLPRVRVGPARVRRRRAQRRHSYNGETKLLLFQNLHRYAMYVARRLPRRPLEGRHRRGHRLEGRRARRASGRSCMFTNCILLTRLHVRLPQLPPPRRRQREQLLDGVARAASATGSGSS